jgi:hypothetical protein
VNVTARKDIGSADSICLHIWLYVAGDLLG